MLLYYRRRARGEDGAALVEFALVLPILVMLALGIMTGGIVVNRKLDVSHATREGARYGATLPALQCVPTSNCAGKTWAQLSRDVVVQRSFNDLAAGVGTTAGVTSAGVCVALVSGSPAAVYSNANPVVGQSNYSTNGSSPCYDDGSADTGLRVQVSVMRTGDNIECVFFRIPITLKSQASAHFEAA